MATLESKLVVSLLDRLSGPSRAVSGAIGRLSAAANANSAKLAAMRGRLIDAAAAGYTLYNALRAPVTAALAFEARLEDIGQKADIPRERLEALGKQLREVGRQATLTGAEAADGMDVLVGMGASESDALGMLPAIGKAATAYNASVQDLASAGYAALDNLKVPAEQFGQALDSMAQAGKAGAFELKDMARYFPSLGAGYQALGQQGVPAVADLAAALQIVRKGTGDSASAATNLGNLLQKIRAPQTVKAFKKLGINLEKELKKASQRGLTPIEAIAEITEKAVKGDLGKLGDLFSDAQVQGALRPLLQNIDEYRKIRAEAMAAQGIVEEDYQRRLETGAGAAKRLNVALDGMKTSIGSALLPGLADVATRLVPIADGIAKFAENNPELTRTVVALTSALIGLNVALIGTRYAFLFLKGGILSAGLGLLRGAAGILRFGGLLAALPSVALSAMTAVGAAIASVTAPVWLTVAAIVAAVAAVGIAVWNYWEPISNFAIGFGSVIGDAIGDVATRLSQFASDVAGMVGQKLLDGAEWLGLDPDAIRASFDNSIAAVKAGAAQVVAIVKAIPGEVGNWLADIFTMNDYTDIEEAKFRAAGMRAAEAIVDGIRSLPAKINAMIGEISTAAAQIGQAIYDGVAAKVAALASYITNSISSAVNSVASKLTFGLVGGGGGGDAPAVDGARAEGGPVSAGKTYLVGERGPELFAPARSGFVSPNEVFAKPSPSTAPASKAAGGDTINHISVTVTAQTNASADDIARLAAERVGHAMQTAVEGSLGGGWA
jgi:TP901 family phage tail tape measure protein